MVEKYIPEELKVSEQALNKIKALIQDEAKDDLSLRVFVTGGGCSGFQYGFKLDSDLDEEDTKVEKSNISIVVDSLSLQYIFGSTLDYKEDLEGSKFIIENPNAVTTCGCGSSFSI